MKNKPGYPLPAGELGSDEIVCQLVYLPDRPEYWQAFYAALHYMTTWRAWERDDDKRGKDAATNWRAAFELTSECWRMTCLEQLQDDVAEILAIMQLGNPCCDDMDITDGDQYTDRVEDGEGDVPQNIIDAGYASGTSDWAGFDDYKCMIVHVTVNQMSARLNELSELVNEYGAVAGSAAAIAAILAVVFATGGVAIVFGLVAGVGAVSLLYESLMGFPLLGNLADKVDTNHDDLACSMYFDTDGDVEALAALNSRIDDLFTVPEALILKNLNMGPTLKSLYSGRYDQQDIAEILSDAGYDLLDFDCSGCTFPQRGEYLETFDFPVDAEGWQGGTWAGGSLGAPYTGEIKASSNVLRDKVGLNTFDAGDYVDIYRVSFDYIATYSTLGVLQVVIYSVEDGAYQEEHVVPFHPSNWSHMDIVLPAPKKTDGQTTSIRFNFPYATGNNWYIDNVVVDYDAPPA